MAGENKKMNIFILEDDPSFLGLLKLRLQSWDKNIVFHISTSINEAKEFLENLSVKIDVAILDHFLPDGTGDQLFNHKSIEYSAKIAMSSDDLPTIPSVSVRAGAMHFIHKKQIAEPLFIPLVQALLERKEFENQAFENKLNETRIKTIKTLLATLEHEINNPLGAVIGGIFLLKSTSQLSKTQESNLKLIEESGNRIKEVIKELKIMTMIQQIAKGNIDTFHLPKDEKWEKET